MTRMPVSAKHDPAWHKQSDSNSISNLMPHLLLELFSEEIPARMQAKAAEDLRKLVTDRLVEAGLVMKAPGPL